MDGYVSFIVGTQGWSGAGYNVAGNGVNTEWWNADTRFHLAYMSPGTAPASIAVIVADGADMGSQPAKVALGDAFNDNGAVFPAVGPKANDDWQGDSMRRDEAEWVVTANTVNVAGANGIELYNLGGQLVKKTAGTTLGLSNLAKGVYVAKSGNQAKKIVVK